MLEPNSYQLLMGDTGQGALTKMMMIRSAPHWVAVNRR